MRCRTVSCPARRDAALAKARQHQAPRLAVQAFQRPSTCKTPVTMPLSYQGQQIPGESHTSAPWPCLLDAYAFRQRVLFQQLGMPALLHTGSVTASTARVYSTHSGLNTQQKAFCVAVAHEVLSEQHAHLAQLKVKHHTQLQLCALLKSCTGQQLLAVFKHTVLRPLIEAGMHVAAFEVVLSQNNTKPKPHYKGFYIANKLGCQHQDLRADEPWFEQPDTGDLPGSLRLVYDLNKWGQRWFEFRLLRQTALGLLLDGAPLLQVHSDLVAFDRMDAGSGGFFSPGGSWIFHARRSTHPHELGVSVVVDVVVTAGLGGLNDAEYSHTAAYKYFHT